ncbi:MAG: enhanced serine sensitivity protein SseB C-terminal domain-containing protein [Alphaproteobacteria bacterium]
MSFDPQNELERLLIKAMSDAASRPLFYRELAQSNIFTVQRDAPSAERQEHTINAGETIEIHHIEYEGQQYIPIFSSLAQLQAVTSSDVAYLEVNALDFMKITLGTPLLLNPGSEYGKEFPPSEVAAILDGSLWQTTEEYSLTQETQIMIGDPATHPDELINALESFFATKPQVRRAWLAHFYNPSDELPPHTLIAFECDGDYRDILQEAGVVIQGVEVPDPPVDLLPITGEGGLEDYFLNEAEPFYQQPA